MTAIMRSTQILPPLPSVWSAKPLPVWIGTFQSITLFGTGDPKIMAGDISMALVTTAQGLIAALLLVVLLHRRLQQKQIDHSRSDEQSAGIIAEHAESFA